MQATAAVLYEVKKPVIVEDVELMEPGAHEVLVRWTANGVCHSDLMLKGEVKRSVVVYE